MSEPIKFHVQELRPEVMAFALLMEQRLRDKDAEKGQSWREMAVSDLYVGRQPRCCSLSVRSSTAMEQRRCTRLTALTTQ